MGTGFPSREKRKVSGKRPKDVMAEYIVPSVGMMCSLESIMIVTVMGFGTHTGI